MTKAVERCAAEVEFRALAEKIGAKVVAKVQPGWSKTAEADPDKFSHEEPDEFNKAYKSSVYRARHWGNGEIILYLDPEQRFGPSRSFTDCASWTEALVDLKRYLRQNHPEKFTLDELTAR